ncbi:phenylacetate--CoA ligase family protein [Aquimarina sp. AU58]|uniref:phenylacetate--CoA ligase family protein n=1 Tax=Aquimarina sp. AU58 TaxID=1874112 RepID=UPI000D64A3FD|nr:AMP-binding protein [Aquimarina sp. AU58]
MNYQDVINGMNLLKEDYSDKQQNTLFVSTFKKAIEKSKYYRDLIQSHGVYPSDISGIEDISKLPIIEVELFLNTPFVNDNEVVRFCQTSGSTGKPKIIPYTKNDIDNAVISQVRSFIFSGIKQYEKCLCVMAYGPWASGLICQSAGELIGLTIPAEVNLGVDYQLWALKHCLPDYMICLPSFLPYLEKICIDYNMDTTSLSLKKIFLVGEVFSDEFRQTFQKLFDVEIFNIYANTEFGLIATECSHGKLHIWDDMFYTETINPETGEYCKEGEIGELIITALQREAVPLIRYNTHDLVQVCEGTCDCGHTGTYFSEIKGRGDDVFTYAGGNVYPAGIEKAVTSVNGLSNIYKCIIQKVNNRDHFHFQIETRENFTQEKVENLKKVFFEELIKSNSLLKVIFLDYKLTAKPDIDILPPGGLGHKSGKVKKIIDMRIISSANLN